MKLNELPTELSMMFDKRYIIAVWYRIFIYSYTVGAPIGEPPNCTAFVVNL